MNRAATPPLLAAPRAACHSARSRPRSTLGPVAPDHSFPETGLPSGLFLLQGGCRALTVDGRVVRLAPSRNPTVLRNESSLFNSVNSQVLFLDWDGHLQSVSAGKAVDCVDFSLCLTIPTPIFAFASPESHPLPRFVLCPQTATLHVKFAHEPTFADPTSPSRAWMDDEWIVESVPVRAVKREDGRTTVVMNELFGKLFGSTATATSTANPGLAPDSSQASSSTLRTPSPDPAAVEEELDSDSDESDTRALRVVKLSPKWRDTFPGPLLSRRASSTEPLDPKEAKLLRLWRRRQFCCTPVTVRPITNPSGAAISPVLMRNSLSSLGLTTPPTNVTGMRPLRTASAAKAATSSSTLPSSHLPLPAPAPTNRRWSSLLSFPSVSALAPVPSVPVSPTPRSRPGKEGDDEDDDYFELIPKELGDWDDAMLLRDAAGPPSPLEERVGDAKTEEEEKTGAVAVPG